MKWKHLFRSPRRRAAARVIRRADAARDGGRYGEACSLYREALRLAPNLAGIHVQAGHMAKETGDFAAAEKHYLDAAKLLSEDADLALQFGHLYKISGRFDEAVDAYRRAAELAPGWVVPRTELGHMARAGWQPSADHLDPAPPLADPFASDPESRPFDPKIATAYGQMAPELLPRPFRDLIRHSEPSLNITRFGVHRNTYWGMLRIVRGVEAIRGFCIAVEPLTDVTVLVDGLPIHRGPMKGPYELEYEANRNSIQKYVFNVWADFSRFCPGKHTLELRFVSNMLQVRTLYESFVVEPPLREANHPTSDAVIELAPGDTRSIAEQINSRPSMVHDAARPDRTAEMRSILVIRPDQLGDLVASIPALFRLRELFPAAKIVGLLSRANADLARSLDVIDEILVFDFPESMKQRTRTLSLEKQEELRDRLAPYRFDIAIDLSSSRMSRPLLALSGAAFLYGFRNSDWPRLDASVDGDHLDPKNGSDITTHSTRVLTLIERLAILFKPAGSVVRREELSRDRLAAFGIGPADRFAVIHTGARIVFSRWPHYRALAEWLHRDTDLKIVIFTDGSDPRGDMPADIAGSDRFALINRQLSFDDFDAMLSFCEVFVGNDSGPKHLASLRGVPVVSIHSARIDWREWGQEQTGVIITRKVPCAGCLVYHDVDECGADFVCVTAIGLDEVYGAVRRYV